MLITDAMTVFRQGKELANAKVWRDRQQAGNKLAAVLLAAVAVAHGLGYQINIDSATVQAIAFGVAALVAAGNSILHAATHVDAGLPASRASAPEPELPAGGDGA